jgi:hypothetical protein
VMVKQPKCRTSHKERFKKKRSFTKPERLVN